MFCKPLLVQINSKVPFHENLPPLPSHSSVVPGSWSNMLSTFQKLQNRAARVIAGDNYDVRDQNKYYLS